MIKSACSSNATANTFATLVTTAFTFKLTLSFTKLPIVLFAYKLLISANTASTTSFSTKLSNTAFTKFATFVTRAKSRYAILFNLPPITAFINASTSLITSACSSIATTNTFATLVTTAFTLRFALSFTKLVIVESAYKLLISANTASTTSFVTTLSSKALTS